MALLLAGLGLAPSWGAAEVPAPTAPGPDFRITSLFPKYATADIEFRDPTGARWPNFFHGRPGTEAGFIHYEIAKPAATFTLVCDKMAQPNGDQSRKVLGELCPPGQPPVVWLAIHSMGPIQAPAASGKDQAAGKSVLEGVLEVGGRKVPVKTLTSFRHHGGKGDEKNAALMLESRFDLKASDLGLKTLPAGAVIEVRVGLTAYPPQPAVAPKGKTP